MKRLRKSHDPNLITKAAFARHRTNLGHRLTRQRVQALAREGKITMVGNRVDKAASDALLDAQKAAQIPKGETITAARRNVEIYAAHMARLDYEERIGNLVNAADDKAAQFKTARIV